MVAIETSIWARVEMGELDTQKRDVAEIAWQSCKCGEVVEILTDSARSTVTAMC